ncbi:MAG: FKBP-type peptidyl-prolyl cis-trans isomerase [Muribaculaceae bacterium]|nr:FKBP-type peptidyl-prolyl cis-trans isomerase [Muribaculaceae bacterium]
MNETISNGKFVAFSYKVTDNDSGRVLFEASENAPDAMVYGVSQEVIPGLVETLKGLKAGDKFSVTLPPEVAFGHRSEDNVIEVPVEAFMRDGQIAEEVVVNATLPMMTAEGYTVTGTVKEIGDKAVVMDFNHPFAGLTVNFEGQVQEVRPATEEELNPKHGGCCGGCGGGGGGGCHDGGCGDGNCGDGGCGCH